MLNVIEQAKLTRIIAGLSQRVQRAEGYFAGVPLSAVRIVDASITSAKIIDGSITTAKIANATITDAKINDLNATKITTGTLEADRIAAGVITATKLDTVTTITTLSAISANLGTVDAGTVTGVTITGGTVRTASSGSRVELTGSPERLTVYDGSDKRVLMGEGSVVMFGNNSVRLYRGSSIYGQWSCSSTSFNLVCTNEGGSLKIACNEGADIVFQANDKINLIAPTVKFDGVTKTAIVPIGKDYKALYCAESPEVWFMDFYKGKIDEMFEQVTEGELIEFDCVNGKKLAFAKRKGFSQERFTKKTRVEFERNNKFYASS